MGWICYPRDLGNLQEGMVLIAGVAQLSARLFCLFCSQLGSPGETHGGLRAATFVTGTEIGMTTLDVMGMVILWLKDVERLSEGMVKGSA